MFSLDLSFLFWMPVGWQSYLIGRHWWPTGMIEHEDPRWLAVEASTRSIGDWRLAIWAIGAIGTWQLAIDLWP